MWSGFTPPPLSGLTLLHIATVKYFPFSETMESEDHDKLFLLCKAVIALGSQGPAYRERVVSQADRNRKRNIIYYFRCTRGAFCMQGIQYDLGIPTQ